MSQNTSGELEDSLFSVIIILLYRQTFCHHCQQAVVTHPSLLPIATNEIFLRFSECVCNRNKSFRESQTS